MNEDGDLLRADSDIAASLPKTWGPLFGRFGRLRNVQRRAIPPILAGDDVLIVAPTASGKTEAACAPLIERIFHRRRWTILYISPTRALVNDLYERLDGPVGQLGLSLRRRTSDHKDPLRDIANVILTTPESFDSLLCRGRHEELGHVLGYVGAVVLDEVHLLEGTARGEQLRWLLERLRRLRGQMVESRLTNKSDVQTLALSATVSDSALVAAAYLRRDPTVVTVGGSRSIETVSTSADLPTVEQSLPHHLNDVDSQKVLVFSNSRMRVDRLARGLSEALGPIGYQVRAHHGSLAQAERELTEAAVKTTDRIVVCATMTLEIGIDIGDIDLVVLDAPAPSVSSLLQRIGRGNRRTDVTRLMMCSGSVAEALVHASMLEAARRGDLGISERGPQYAVARQQSASYIFQAPNRSRPRAQIVNLSSVLLPDVDSAPLIDHLVTNEEFVEDPSGLRLGEVWRDRATKGQIHSNIEDAGGYKVVDAATGAQIGKGIRSQSGRGLGVAGKLLEVRKWDDFRILVHKAASEDAGTGEWSYVSQAWMRGAGQPRAVQSYLRIPLDEWPVLSSNGMLCAFHFGGSRRKAVLQLVLDFAGRTAVSLDDWAIWLPAEGNSASQAPQWLSAWVPSQLEVMIDADRLPRLERLLARPSANKSLPTSLRTREVAHWLDLHGEHDAFSRASWKPPVDPAARTALLTIATSLRGAG